MRELQGKTLAQIAAQWKSDPLDTLFDILIKDQAFTEVAVFGMSEPDVALALSQPWVSVDNDSQGTSPTGPLGLEHPHPRAYGTFPRILRKYVREEHLLTLEDAIRKFTALPAQRMRLADRGVIKQGLWADIVVFDPDQIADKATFENPNQLSVGMRFVLVNGVPVIADGQRHERPAGQGLARCQRDLSRIHEMIITRVGAAALAAGLLATTQQPPTFRTGAYTVAVYTTVTDAGGRLVPDLDRDQFEVYDNGKLQKITTFANDIQPITVVMMLDRSVSMRRNFDLVRKAAEAFVEALLPADKAKIGSFSNRVQVDPREFTSDKNELQDILQTELQEEGPTPLWNAVSVGMTALLHVEGRRVVLVFTDGMDSPMPSATNISFREVGKRAEQEDVMVYAIGLAGQTSFGRGYRGNPGGGYGGGGYGGGGYGHGGYGGGHGGDGWIGPILASRSSRRKAAEATSS